MSDHKNNGEQKRMNEQRKALNKYLGKLMLIFLNKWNYADENDNTKWWQIFVQVVNYNYVNFLPPITPDYFLNVRDGLLTLIKKHKNQNLIIIKSYNIEIKC